MFKDSRAFSGFSVDDLETAKQFYGRTLGLEVAETDEGLTLKLTGGTEIFIYPKHDHSPASFTILNFPVPDIDKAIDDLVAAGIALEHYEGGMQDERGVFRGASRDMGPDIAWFKDPAGNILSVIQA